MEKHFQGIKNCLLLQDNNRFSTKGSFGIFFNWFLHQTNTRIWKLLVYSKNSINCIFKDNNYRNGNKAPNGKIGKRTINDRSIMQIKAVIYPSDGIITRTNISFQSAIIDDERRDNIGQRITA